MDDEKVVKYIDSLFEEFEVIINGLNRDHKDRFYKSSKIE